MRKLRQLIEHPAFTWGITTLIILNAITLGLETSSAVMARAGGFITALDLAFVSIFTLEITLKLVAYRLQFFRSGWNWFDLIIVVISLLPFLGNLSVLRALRILRVLRLISVVPALRKVVQGFLDAITGLLAVAGILLLIFYVAGVMATKLFGEAFPEFFGSLGASLYSLFQIMTLESWSMGIVRPVMEVYPLAWAFFVPFILLTTFAVLNLLIGIIVNSMQTVHEAEEARLTERIDRTHAGQRDIEEKLDALEQSIAELRALVSERRDRGS
ncbi:ion transporter [Patescibacteria group bacterium]|jgi:voltage-gated sodium channel|nr:ion transporter [Patescibacteria group bacterium]